MTRSPGDMDTTQKVIWVLFWGAAALLALPSYVKDWLDKL